VTTRSTAILRYVASASTYTAVYTVPQGTVVLVKDSRVHVTTSVSLTWSIWASHPANGAVASIGKATTTADQDWVLSGWLVLEPGDEIFVSVTGGPVYFWMSGALLPVGST